MPPSTATENNTNATTVRLPPSRTQLAAAADRAQKFRLHKRFFFILLGELLVIAALAGVLFHFTKESLVLWLLPMLILFIAFPIQMLRHILLVYEGDGIGAYEAINLFREQLRRRNNPELMYESPPTYETARDEPPAYIIEMTDTSSTHRSSAEQHVSSPPPLEIVDPLASLRRS
ncbi:hypothetical protein K7432_009254 [Basidiobolus ranarum]|uniref:Uncharacterized protein n=1 Tax=Basidiobolus ranarum TaxID=34480 RepID=A0ABR2VXC9_9FUNG